MTESATANGSAPRREIPPAGARGSVKLICAWCGAIIKDGPGPISHGICDPCAASFNEPEE